MSDLTEIARKKVALRTAALALRDALPAAERQAAAEAIATRGLPVEITPATIVSGFMPMKTEINPIPLLRKLAAAGAQLALPAIAGRGKPLIMRAWHFGAPLKDGQWGIREPLPEAGEVAPDISLYRRSPSTAPATASATAPATTTRASMPCARRRRYRHRHRFCRAGNPPRFRHGARRALDLVLTEPRLIDFRGFVIKHAHSLYRRCGGAQRAHGRLLSGCPGLVKDWKLDLVVINGENAAGGFGITEVIYNELIDAGADAVTLGNHSWDQREALVFIERAPRLIRPVNYPRARPAAAPLWSTPRTASARW